jgi:hypothetical protein
MKHDPAILAEVRADACKRLHAVIETVQNAINTQPRKKP